MRDIETYALAQATVLGRKGRLERARRHPPGLGLAVAFGLPRIYLVGDVQQDLVGVVPEFDDGHGFRGRDHRARERLPLRQYRFDVCLDEVAQAHGAVCAVHQSCVGAQSVYGAGQGLS
ncbi:hypothetical protein WKW82_34795 [Variovorax rhizosphaerae]|uniref:Uncharacterized protein n=1 Tax=Variovorax rhizosphaerae TaxID=1836200 RepID=A0ABU8WWC6_9BURK